MKISIITATYNSAKTLQDTINSVLSQDYPDFEHIIVDGNSKDETVEIIRSNADSYKSGQLKWISEPDKGIYDAMNKGISMATGDVVGLLNSDDFYASTDVLSTVVAAMDGDDAIDAVYGDVCYVKANDTSKLVRHYSSRYFRRFNMHFGFMPAHPSFYCRKKIYEQHRLAEGRYFDTSYKVASDFEFLVRTIYVGKIRTLYINKDFVRMRVGGASSSGLSSHRAIITDHLRALKRNRVYSNSLMLAMRYPFKIIDLIAGKFIK